MSVLVTHPEPEILHELMVDDGRGRARDLGEKIFEIRIGHIVAAGDADQIQTLQPELGLGDTQLVDLAAGADHRQTLDALLADRIEQAQTRRETRLVPSGAQHLLGCAGEDRLGLETGPRRGGGGDNGLDPTLLEQTGAKRGDHAGPLCLGIGTGHARRVHGAIDAEPALVACLSWSTVQTLLDGARLVAHEGAGLRH